MKLCAERPSAPRVPTRSMGASLRRVVAMVEDEHPLGEEEGDEAGSGERADLARVVEVLERLREHVEERHRDHDPAGERDQRRQRVGETQAERPTGQGRDDGCGCERDRDPLHAPRMIIVIITAYAFTRGTRRSDGAEWAQLAHAALHQAGHRSGRARAAVIELLAAEACCVSAQEIADRLRRRGRPVGTASVYRALDLLTRAGVVARVEVGEWRSALRGVAPGGEHHHHLVCDSCGEITPFSDPALERAIDRLAGRVRHRVRGHEVVLRGATARAAASGSAD